MLPTEVDGWAGRPGLAGHREGRHPFPRLALAGEASVTTDADGAHRLTATAADAEAGLELVSEMRLEAGGLLRVRHTITNAGDGRYTLQELLALLPVPGRAGELLDLTGRWCRERSPQRRPLAHGALARESRRGRTGPDATHV
ncbi:MAG: glycoside hydrolase family 36 N-terminal domain-containing protein, partial [Kineosporiaceae bacterium]